MAINPALLRVTSEDRDNFVTALRELADIVARTEPHHLHAATMFVDQEPPIDWDVHPDTDPLTAVRANHRITSVSIDIEGLLDR